MPAVQMQKQEQKGKWHARGHPPTKTPCCCDMQYTLIYSTGKRAFGKDCHQGTVLYSGMFFSRGRGCEADFVTRSRIIIRDRHASVWDTLHSLFFIFFVTKYLSNIPLSIYLYIFNFSITSVFIPQRHFKLGVLKIALITLASALPSKSVSHISVNDTTICCISQGRKQAGCSLTPVHSPPSVSHRSAGSIGFDLARSQAHRSDHTGDPQPGLCCRWCWRVVWLWLTGPRSLQGARSGPPQGCALCTAPDAQMCSLRPVEMSV